MGIKFNADEVFELAIRAEENGAAFYRRAAELYTGDESDVAFLLQLAKMEDNHKTTFQAMRAELGDKMKESTAFDPYMEASLYLNAMADGSDIEGAKSEAEKLTGNETLTDILTTAIRLEKEAVLFYSEMQEMVPEKLGKDKIDSIIAEEKGHVVQLANALKAARDT